MNSVKRIVFNEILTDKEQIKQIVDFLEMERLTIQGSPYSPFIMTNEQTNKIIDHGFLPDEIKPEDYIFGGLQIPLEILQDSGQWDEFLPEKELQNRNGLETMNCVTYGTLNIIETLLKRLFGQEINNSERYIGVMAGTSKGGNTPQRVIETIRKEAGLIDETLLPFDDTIKTWEEYYSPNPMNPDYISKGKEWLERYLIKHEWVFKPGDQNKQKKLKEALRFSPLGVSVYAWEKDGEYYAKEEGDQDNHWVMLFGYSDGKFWKVFDHYDNVIKKLTWDYDFGFAKRYYLSGQIKKKESLWEKIKKLIKKLWQ